MSQGRIEYVAVPDSFFELGKQHPNLVIFDVHAGLGVSRWFELVPYWLPISAADLPGVLKWLPPETTVVFCCKNATEQLGGQTKTMLLQLGIGTVYFLSNNPVFQGNHCFDPVTARDAKLRTTKDNGDGNEALLMT
ncbi:MAG: hypothetical protein ABSD75_30280 [Terriglobales bacterium]|jgi:hypothetical protein